MHKVIEELLDSGLELIMTKVKGEVCYKVEGFFKSGTVTLKIIDENELVCFSRYDQVDSVYCLGDLVLIAYHWWQVSCQRSEEGYVDPGTWAKAFEDAGLVKKETKTYYR